VLLDITTDDALSAHFLLVYVRAVFLNRRPAARYRALASVIPVRERFSWNLSL